MTCLLEVASVVSSPNEYFDSSSAHRCSRLSGLPRGVLTDGVRLEYRMQGALEIEAEAEAEAGQAGRL